MDSLLKRLENAYRLLYGRGKVHSQSHFATILGKSKSQISDAFKERYGKLTSSLLELIADTFPDDINKEYMLTGEGSVEKISSLGGIPHFKNLTVAAGYFDGYETPNDAWEIREEPTGMSDAEFSIEVSGDSMYPEIHNGDTLYLKQHLDHINLPLHRLCVVDSEEGGGVVKQLADADQKYLYLHSLNPDYKDIRIKRTEVRHLYRVVGITRKY